MRRYLGQRGQQPLRVVQGGPAVGQTVGHVSQLLPDRGKSDLDGAQARPVQLAPALQIAEHRQSLAVQPLEDSGRCVRSPVSAVGGRTGWIREAMNGTKVNIRTDLGVCRENNTYTTDQESGIKAHELLATKVFQAET